MTGRTQRRAALEAAHREAARCRRCPGLAPARTQVVVGAGDPDADLLFVTEAPRRVEDELGVPLAGRAGELLTQLLDGIGLRREAVFVACALKCHPPGNRDPLPGEVANCLDHLHRQVELVQPRVVCPLGSFATRLLRGEPAGVRAVHGRAEVRTVGARAVWLLPLFHPAAALYAPPLLAALRADVAAIPELLAREAPAQPAPADPPPPADPEPPAAGQMGLF